MTDNTEREWPTFGDILNELNTLGHLSQVTPSTDTIVEPVAAAPAPAPVVEAAPAPAPVVETVAAAPVETLDSTTVAAPAAPAIDHDIVVPILPPSTLDTSLLAGSTTDAPEATFDTSALEPLAPAPDVHDLAESADVLPISEPDADAGSVFDAPALAAEPMTFEPVEVETPNLDPMAFETIEPAPPAPMETPGFEPMVFDTPDFATEEVSMDWAESPIDGALAQDPPFTGDEPGSVIAFDPPAAGTVGETAEEFTSTDWSTGVEPSTEMDAEDGNFDSVATADAIESDLQDLFALDQSVSEDNFSAFMGDSAVDDDAPVADVVPLHPTTDDGNEEVFRLDAVFDPAAPVDEEPIQAWVGIQDEEETREDPWAYMRPDEAEDIKGGFWANRPKFFGGAERKAKKAARQQAAAAQEMRSDIAGPTCPNCNEIGQVDLDDPVGGKIHASCQNCGHVWSQASDAELRTESA